MRCWKISSQGGINHNAYCINRMCRDSPLTAEFLPSNKSLLASVTPPNYMLCTSVVSLCQQLFLPEQIEAACLILVADCTCVWESGCVRVSCASCIQGKSPSICFHRAHQVLPVRLEKRYVSCESFVQIFSIKSSSIYVFSLAVYTSNDPAKNLHHIKQPRCLLRNEN